MSMENNDACCVDSLLQNNKLEEGRTEPGNIKLETDHQEFGCKRLKEEPDKMEAKENITQVGDCRLPVQKEDEAFGEKDWLDLTPSQRGCWELSSKENKGGLGALPESNNASTTPLVEVGGTESETRAPAPTPVNAASLGCNTVASSEEVKVNHFSEEADNLLKRPLNETSESIGCLNAPTELPSEPKMKKPKLSGAQRKAVIRAKIEARGEKWDPSKWKKVRKKKNGNMIANNSQYAANKSAESCYLPDSKVQGNQAEVKSQDNKYQDGSGALSGWTPLPTPDVSGTETATRYPTPVSGAYLGSKTQVSNEEVKVNAFSEEVDKLLKSPGTSDSMSSLNAISELPSQPREIKPRLSGAQRKAAIREKLKARGEEWDPSKWRKARKKKNENMIADNSKYLSNKPLERWHSPYNKMQDYKEEVKFQRNQDGLGCLPRWYDSTIPKAAGIESATAGGRPRSRVSSEKVYVNPSSKAVDDLLKSPGTSAFMGSRNATLEHSEQNLNRSNLSTAQRKAVIIEKLRARGEEWDPSKWKRGGCLRTHTHRNKRKTAPVWNVPSTLEVSAEARRGSTKRPSSDVVIPQYLSYVTSRNNVVSGAQRDLTNYPRGNVVTPAERWYVPSRTEVGAEERRGSTTHSRGDSVIPAHVSYAPSRIGVVANPGRGSTEQPKGDVVTPAQRWYGPFSTKDGKTGRDSTERPRGDAVTPAQRWYDSYSTEDANSGRSSTERSRGDAFSSAQRWYDPFSKEGANPERGSTERSSGDAFTSAQRWYDPFSTEAANPVRGSTERSRSSSTEKAEAGRSSTEWTRGDATSELAPVHNVSSSTEVGVEAGKDSTERPRGDAFTPAQRWYVPSNTEVGSEVGRGSTEEPRGDATSVLGPVCNVVSSTERGAEAGRDSTKCPRGDVVTPTLTEALKKEPLGNEFLGASSLKDISSIPIDSDSTVIKMAIVPKGFPEARLSGEEGDIIEDALMDTIPSMGDVSCPSFAGTYFDKGALIVSCLNEATTGWLESIMSTFRPLGDDFILMAGLWEDTQTERVFFKTHPKLLKRSPDTVINMLHERNPSLNVKEWKVLSTRSEPDGHNFVCSIDEACLEALKKCNFKGNLGLWQVRFVHFNNIPK